MKIVIFGGNGFVGARVAKYLSGQQHQVTAVSRSGTRPVHLENQAWADNVTWVAGDAGNPDQLLLQNQDVVVSTVGAPPIPTFSKAAYQKSLNTNGLVNESLFEAAANCDVKRVILLGAKLPAAMQGDWFAYAKGKRLALAAAEKFSSSSEKRSAVVIQPGAMFGKRYKADGKAVPLDKFMKPFARLMPSQLIDVEVVAQCVADAAAGLRATEEAFVVIPHEKIIMVET